jgi:AAA ATPase domain
MTERGTFIGVAVETYERHPRLPWTRIDLLEMDDLFSELGFPQHLLLGDKQGSPTVGELTDWLQGSIRESDPDEPLVLYWAGHGVLKDGVHYLLASDSPADALSDENAVAAAALAEFLVEAKVERALILLDVCNAGAGAMDLATAINEGLRSKTAEGAGESGIVVMAVSRPSESAVDGALATVFKDAVLTDERTGTFRDKYVRLGGLFDLLNESLSGGRTARPVSANVVDWTAPLNLLPNPRWGRGGPVWNPTDGVYFDREARGATGDQDTGWYFAGRERVLKRIAEWLAPGRNGEGLLAVYGPPGCGKSAVLARAITASRPDYREAARASPGWGPADEEGMAPESSIGAAIHAGGKPLDKVVDELAALLGIELPERPDQTGDLALTRRRGLLEELQAMAWKEPVTVVLDGLDEAKRGQDLALAEFLADVAAADRLRVLVGTRPKGRRGLGDEHGEDLLSALGVEPGDDIDLSDSKWESDQALEGYLRKRLLVIWRESTLENLDDLATAVAETMALRLEGQFHVARLVVGPNSVLARRGPPADLSKLEFPTEVGQAISEDLERFADSSVVELLRALAWAEGDGFSHTVWLVVAGALSPMRRFEQDAVERAISAAGDYLIPSGEDEAGRRRWRLHHSTYTEYFQRLTLEDEGADERAVEKRILEQLTPASWEGAEFYVLTNLATHAEKAGVLGELVRDPDYLVHADPTTLLASVASLAPDDEGRPTARRYGRIVHHLIGATPGERAAYLELAAREDSDPSARPTRREDQPWSSRWASMKSAGARPDRILPAPRAGKTVSLHRLAERNVAVTGGERVQVIDLVTGRSLFSADRGGNPYSKGPAALVEEQSGPHVVSLVEVPENPRDELGNIDTTSVITRRWLRSWNLATREEASLLTGQEGEVIRGSARPFAVGGNRWLAVALSGGSVWVQKGLSGEWWLPATLLDVLAACVFVQLYEDDCVVLVGAETGDLVACPVLSAAGPRVKAHTSSVTALASTSTDGGYVVASSDRDELHVWRLAQEFSLEGPLCSTEPGVEAVACAEVNGQLLVAGVAEGQGRLWRADLEVGRMELVTRLEAGANHLNDLAFGGSRGVSSYLVGAAGTTGQPNVLNVSGWTPVSPESGSVYVWEGRELASIKSTFQEQVRPLQLVAPARGTPSASPESVLALWEGNWITAASAADGVVARGFPLWVGAGALKASAFDVLELDSGETVMVIGYESGLVVTWTSSDEQVVGTETGGRPIRSIAVLASPLGRKQMLALDDRSNLHYFAWERRLDDGSDAPPDVANSLYTATRAWVGVDLSGGEPVVTETRPLQRVVYGLSTSELRGSPVFVISGGAGCVFVDPMRVDESIDVGLDFPVADATLVDGYLAVRGSWEVLLFDVGDDPSRVSKGVYAVSDNGMLSPTRGEDPIWRGSWAAPVSAMSLRTGPNGPRLAVGCSDGAVHVYEVGDEGVTIACSVECDSPVTDVLSLSDGGTVIATWRGLLCLE